ncbi:HAD family hydrolase [Alteromonas sediminis]|uniref:HAD family hydrolase n=1 Tax=Alteromonas sediminis TaxID=2259342 RepID=A0A3N5Y0B3_9ALTE|nr:HAD-IA family hydrolase [Alteromonas sediminis]RPJ66490.1 HAD family hydrolase [Alteromonas sediminis]
MQVDTSFMLDLTNIKGVIFDLDGTLVESSLDFAKMRAEIGCPPNEDILTFIDNIACPDEKAKAQDIVLQQEMDDAYNAKMLPIGEVMLKQVAQAKLPVGLVTRNCKQATEIKLSNNHISMDVVLTREDAPAKPDPTALLQIAEMWSIAPENLIYVGDYIYDQQAADNAGMRCQLV